MVYWRVGARAVLCVLGALCGFLHQCWESTAVDAENAKGGIPIVSDLHTTISDPQVRSVERGPGMTLCLK